VVMFAAAALHDPQTERVLRTMFASFAGSGPGAQLVARLGGMLAGLLGDATGPAGPADDAHTAQGGA